MIMPVYPGGARRALAQLAPDYMRNPYLVSILTRLDERRQAWWLLDREQRFQGLLGYQRGVFYLYAPANAYDAAAAARLILAWPGAEAPVVAGEEGRVEPLADRLSLPQAERTFHFARLTGALPPLAARPGIREAGVGDVPRIHALRQEILEFGPSMPMTELHALVAGGENRIFYLENGLQRVEAAATLTSRSLYGAVVASVMTHPASRGKGYATALTHYASERVLRAGGTPCLFYDNPEAWRIYQRLGYRVTGAWRWYYL